MNTHNIWPWFLWRWWSACCLGWLGSPCCHLAGGGWNRLPPAGTATPATQTGSCGLPTDWNIVSSTTIQSIQSPPHLLQVISRHDLIPPPPHITTTTYLPIFIKVTQFILCRQTGLSYIMISQTRQIHHYVVFHNGKFQFKSIFF